eukprot:UN24227
MFLYLFRFSVRFKDFGNSLRKFILVRFRFRSVRF